MAFNQVESAWPVHGSVLVAGGIVYCTAGRNSFVDNGIYLYALDAVTGKVLGTNHIHDVQTQDRPDATRMPEESPGARSNILVSNGFDIYMCRRQLDFSTPFKTEPDDYTFDTGKGAYLAVASSFFDDQWFHRIWWTYGKTPGYMLAFDKEATYSVMNPGVSNYKLYVPQGGDLSIIPDRNRLSEVETGIRHMVAVESGLIISKTSNNRPAWRDNAFPIGPCSMVVTEEKLLVAGFRDIIDSADPWANLEGRKNAALWMLSKENGSKLTEYPLETLPVWNGMAAANGNIFVSLKNGKLICLGQ
jgi:outer membrane protein assembly factor BamB